MGHSNSKKVRESLSLVSGEDTLGTPIGPPLILILSPPDNDDEITDLLEAVKKQPLMKGISVDRIVFQENSPLAKHAVVEIRAPLSTFKEAAQRRGLYKKMKTESYQHCSGAFKHYAQDLGLWRPFSMKQEARFFSKEEVDEFFTPAEMLYMLCDILCYVPHSCNELPALLEKAAEGKLTVMSLRDEKLMESVSKNWGWSFLPAGWQGTVPAAELATYFGPGVSLYFVFMQSYMRWLVAPAIFGGILYLVRFFLLPTHWIYHVLQPLYALVIAIWSTVFLTNWRHLIAVNSRRIGHCTLNGDDPMFDQASYIKASQKYSKPPQEKPDSTIQGLRRTPLWGKRGLLQYIFVLFAMALMLGMAVVLIGWLFSFGDDIADTYDNVVIQNLPVVLYLLVVGVCEQFYDKLAEMLTWMEQHQVYKAHLRSLTIKTMAFQLINYLGWFIYVLLWRKDMGYLEDQLFLFFTIKQVIGNFSEVVVPYIQGKREAKKKDAQKNELRVERKSSLTGEEQLKLDIELEWTRPPASVSEDYLEIAVLFAAFSWFAPIFPQGACLALVHVISETAVDRWKMTGMTRRSVPQGTNMYVLEAWLDIFDMLNFMGIAFSMACLFYSGVSSGAPIDESESISLVAHANETKRADVWGLHHVIGVEHLIFFCWLYLRESLPKVPEWLIKHLDCVEDEFPLQDWLSGVRKLDKEEKKD